MTRTLVWAFQPLAELDNEVGLIECDGDLAAKLIEAGDVQSPEVGGLHLKEITMTYTTRKLDAEAPKRARKSKTEEINDK
jgi:hypothetical protein